MELWRQQALFAQHVSQLINYIFEKGLSCSFGEAFRVDSYKAYNYRAQDMHCKRLAIDLHLISSTGEILFEKEHYEDLGRFWETLDPENRWGGNQTCPLENHFERQEIILH